jgi:hypothetical protein
MFRSSGRPSGYKFREFHAPVSVNMVALAGPIHRVRDPVNQSQFLVRRFQFTAEII